MEGYLLKWTNYLFGWQRRYLILHNGILHYCKEKGSAQRGAIHLNISKVQKHLTNSKRFMMSTGTTVIYFKAFTTDEAEDWVRAIKDQQLDLKHTKTHLDALTVSSIILDKVSAMWGIHSQLLNAIELIPPSKSLEQISVLLNEMKNISASTLGIIEHEHENMQKIPVRINRFSCEGAPPEAEQESDLFEDAESGVEEIRRACLPMLRIPKKIQGFWDSLKESLTGRYEELMVPLKYYEPLSTLQRISEEFMFVGVLKEAASTDKADKLIALLLGYIACGFGLGVRVAKPFNAVLGETFEIWHEGVRVLLEQVRLGTTALYCKGEGFQYHGYTEITSHYRNKALEISPLGKCFFESDYFEEPFTWNKPSLNISESPDGKIRLEYNGEVRVTNRLSDFVGVLEFGNGKITGKVTQGQKEIWKLSVDEKVQIKNADETIELASFDKIELQEYSYNFSMFTLQLNLPGVLFESLPETDSRWRKDTRALENGNLQEAETEYVRNLKFSEEKKTSFTAKWFKLDSNEWQFTSKYWDR